MGSKKKRDSKVTVESRTEAVQPIKTDMSKYARAYSNKSKINYADLKLVRPAQTKSPESSEPKKLTNRNPKVKKQEQIRRPRKQRTEKTKKQNRRRNKTTKAEQQKTMIREEKVRQILPA